jgi:hypothetical protein
VHRCLYVDTPWEEDLAADRRDVNDFKEASRMIECVLSVRILESWRLARSYVKFCLLLLQSLAERVQARVGLLREAANAHAEAGFF